MKKKNEKKKKSKEKQENERKKSNIKRGIKRETEAQRIGEVPRRVRQSVCTVGFFVVYLLFPRGLGSFVFH